MKKLLYTILTGCLIAFFMAGPVYATDYYGCKATSNIKSADDVWCTTSTGACTGTTTTAWATVNSSGNNLYANGCAMTIANGDTWNLGTGKLSTEDGAGNGGGSFTQAGTVTATSYIVAGSTTAYILATNATLTLTGNVSVAGTTNSVSGIGMTNSGGTLTIHGNVTGNAGAYTLSHGITSNGAVGSITIDGNVTGGGSVSAYGINIGTGGGATGTVNGTVTGGSVPGADGIRSVSTGAFTVTGLLVNTATSSAASGRITYTPSAASKYIQYGSTYYSTAPTKADIKVGTYSVISSTGAYEDGTYAAAGGCVYGY